MGAGQHRVGSRIGVVTEHWMIGQASGDVAFFAHALGPRWHLGDLSIDAALMAMGEIWTDGRTGQRNYDLFVVPIPWFDVSWHFGP